MAVGEKIKISIGQVKNNRVIADSVINKIIDRVRQNTKADLQHLSAYLTNTITKAYVQAIKFASLNMVGKPSGLGSAKTTTSALAMANFSRVRDFVQGENAFGRVTWSALNRKYMKDKGNNKFFIKSGSLQNYLRSQAESIAKKTGIVRVTTDLNRDERGRFIKNSAGKIATIGNVKIRVMPNIPASILPGIQSGNIGDVDSNQLFESRIIGSKKQLMKLNGPGMRDKNTNLQRSLLQPVFTFWTRYYIPSAIRKGLRGTTK